MPNTLSFSEDMLPRHFPRSHFSKQSEQISVVPQPTLPGVSLIFTSEKTSPKIEPKKSFQKWKEQHEAILTNKTTDHQIKTVKKHVRFETKDYFERSLPAQRIQPPVNPKLELSYYESPNSKGGSNLYHGSNMYQRPNFLHQNHHYQTQRIFHKPNISSDSGVALNSEFTNGCLNPPKTNVNLLKYVPVRRPESMNGNYLYRAFALGQNNQQKLQTTTTDRSQSNPYGCQMNENGFRFANHEAINRNKYGSNGMPERQQAMQELQPSVHILLNILEEQQQHILQQQNQIAMYEKQNLEQQKQICILEYRLQQLLQLSEAIDSISPVKEHKSMVSNEITHGVMFNELQSPNGSHNTPSTGVMTNVLHNINDKCTKEKILSFGTHKYSCQDLLLDQVNTGIRNSSAFIDYGINESYPPNRHSDINISQTFIYEALSTNTSCVNTQKEMDRSYYLNMLGMKYNCTESDTPLYTDEQGLYNNQLSLDGKCDRFREDVPSDTHDYLIRHGLMKR